MKNDKIMIPEVTSNHIFKLIKHIYPAENVMIDRLNGIFGKSKVTNASISGESMGLLIRDKSAIILTKEGMELGRALVSKNVEEQRKILKNCVLKNPVLEFIYSLIREKKIMKNSEIGQKIALQFNKNWKHVLSYSRYGTNCGNILASAGLGYYTNGIYSLEKIGSFNISDTISVPSLRFKKIISILKELSAKEKNIDTLVTALSSKSKSRLSYELTNCVDLNLIKKSDNMYSITDMGRDLTNPVNDSDELRSNIFAEILRKSPYASIIKIIEENGIKDRRKIGQILLHELKKEGKENYQYTVGKIFANWLASSRIITKNRNILPQISKDANKIETIPVAGIPKISIGSDQKIMFQIGRLIERIELKNSLNQDIISDIKELISFCQKDSSLTAYLRLLNSHYQLYNEKKDFRIIQADLNFLKEIYR